MTKAESDNVRPDGGLESAAAQKSRQFAPRIEVSAAGEKSLFDQRDQALHGGSIRTHAPRADLRILHDQNSACSYEPEIRIDLLIGATERCDLKPGVKQIERVWREAGREQIVLNEPYVGQAISSDSHR